MWFARSVDVEGDVAVVENINEVREPGERIAGDGGEVGHRCEGDGTETLGEPEVLRDSEGLRAEVIERELGAIAVDALGSDGMTCCVQQCGGRAGLGVWSQAPRPCSETVARVGSGLSVVLSVAEVYDVEFGADEVYRRQESVVEQRVRHERGGLIVRCGKEEDAVIQQALECGGEIDAVGDIVDVELVEEDRSSVPDESAERSVERLALPDDLLLERAEEVVEVEPPLSVCRDGGEVGLADEALAPPDVAPDVEAVTRRGTERVDRCGLLTIEDEPAGLER
ncbi:hypothetical protein NQ151_004850 [Microbacterium sp. zg-YB36]|nr:hypothetical protein [Microbacterium sp. zg-YB36]MDL5350897.1 hypothetical protein [Microbacterium sp. zg-YB36]